MPPPPLWRAPTPPTHVPTIGGGGAFVRPLRPDADGMARHHSADLDRALAGNVPRAVPAGSSGCSPVLPRRFSAEEVAGGGQLPPLRLEDPLSLVASETTSPQRSPHHRSPQRSPTLRASGARADLIIPAWQILPPLLILTLPALPSHRLAVTAESVVGQLTCSRILREAVSPSCTAGGAAPPRPFPRPPLV